MDPTGRILPVAIEDEVKESYLNYAMSVIVSRALPDVRDGLKPVHRRILFAMEEMGLYSDRAFKKCGRIVGDVLGKYHPHGDQSIYDALVRLAQNFSLRYMAVRGQGNFGSVDGDPPAAMRYTEAKLQKIAEEMIKDIKKETVDFGPNYDDSMVEPLVLPGAFPFLLCNGGSGIAVGMATNIPPHNLREVGKIIDAYIDNPEISIDELIEHISGPDFPTGGIIYGTKGIRDAYKNGKGKIVIRARCTLETYKSGKEAIIVTEIPYMVNKANLIIKIAELVREKRIEGISDIRDESDRDGMRIVLELRRGAMPKIILNHLFAHTQLQVNFGVINLALVDRRPRLLNLKEMVHYFVRHRVDVITRRSRYDLRKAEEREHILIGLKRALENIDEVIAIIRAAANTEIARNNLMERFDFSEIQAQAILDMRLQKLTSLETQKIIDELLEVQALIAYLKDLLSSELKILAVVKQETQEIVNQYGDDRRTEIVPSEIEGINVEDLIQKEDMVVVLSNKGYIKRTAASAYRQQNRGGKGSSSSKLIDEDFIQHLFIASTHDYILFVSNDGRAYWMKVHEIPEFSRNAKGQHIRSLLNISADEDIAAVVSLTEFSEEQFLFMCSSKGIVKKVMTKDFINAKVRGVVAVKIDEGDRIVSAHLTNGNDEVILFTKRGNALRFSEENVRAMGRASRGVCGMRFNKEDEIAAAICVRSDERILMITEDGYGKRMDVDNFSPHGRGTRGQIAYKIADKTGEVVTALAVKDDDDLVCITSQGNTIRVKAEGISILGRNTSGIRILNIEKPDVVVAAAKAEKEDDPVIEE